MSKPASNELVAKLDQLSRFVASTDSEPPEIWIDVAALIARIRQQDAEIGRLKEVLGEYVCDCKGQCQAEIYGGSCGRLAYTELKGGEA